MQKHENRILFLKEFTKHLILNSKKEEVELKIPGIERGIVEIKEPILIPTFQAVEPVIKPIIKPITKEIEEKPKTQIPIQPTGKLPPIPKSISIQRYALKKITPIMPTQIIKEIQAPEGFKLSVISQSQIQPTTTQLQPIATTLPQAFDLGKLSFLVSDPRVTVIECPGPNKLVLARTEGRTLTTKVSLSQEEISSIIEKFSLASKIPVISGLFKAAVGNLIITAVTSEIVGSRFIIAKMTPRFMLEQQGFS